MTRRQLGALISRVIGLAGIATAAMPSVLAGSIAGSIVSVIAGIVVYYAGAILVVASSAPIDRGPPADAS